MGMQRQLESRALWALSKWPYKNHFTTYEARVSRDAQNVCATTIIVTVLNGIRTRDLCDVSAMLYQLSYEATQLGEGQFVGLVCSRERTRWMKEMYIIDLIHDSRHVGFAITCIMQISGTLLRGQTTQVWEVITNTLATQMICFTFIECLSPKQ